MKITFLIPPVLDGTHGVDRCFGCNYGIYFLPLLPVLYAATVLKKDNHAVRIFDFAAKKQAEKDYRAFIIKDDSDIYIFYTVFLSQKTDIIARDIAKSMRGDARFIFIGPQATWSPEVFLNNEDTFVIRGEPDLKVYELVKYLADKKEIAGLAGVSYYRDGKIFHNDSSPSLAALDSIPIPDRSLLDHSFYYNPKLRTLPHTAVLTSRGCFGQCWYCVPNSLSYASELEYKRQFNRKPHPRMHSPERVIEEFRDIAEKGFRSVSIIDDEFLWDEERTIKICEGIKGLKLEWSCLARPDKITMKSAEAMAAAGCAYVDMGTESFDEGVLKAIKKGMSVSDTNTAVRILKECGIEVELNVLFGATPVETEETIKYTLKELKKLDVDYVLFSIANPFPGTDFYYAAKQHGWMVYGDYIPVDPAKNSIISYPHLSKEKLESFVSYAYLSYYFRPKYLLKQIRNIRGIRDLKNKLYAAFKLVKRSVFNK